MAVVRGRSGALVGLVAVAALIAVACGGGGGTSSDDVAGRAAGERAPRESVEGAERAEPAADPVADASSGMVESSEDLDVEADAEVGVGVTLASGVLDLPAATSFQSPGFHAVFEIAGTVPSDIGPTSGLRLVVSLRDVSRPEQQCSSQHPLSGCGTVDWSDGEGRPGVPPGGVLENRLTVALASGERTLFLSESGTLLPEADPFSPG